MMRTLAVGALMAVVITLAPACDRTPTMGSVEARPQAAAAQSATGSAATHPLDPLTEDEIRLAVKVAKCDARLTRRNFTQHAYRYRHLDGSSRQPGVVNV